MLQSETAIYAQGVGLGASKAKEIGKYTEGYSGYVNMVQDAVSSLFIVLESVLTILIRLVSGIMVKGRMIAIRLINYSSISFLSSFSVVLKYYCEISVSGTL